MLEALLIIERLVMFDIISKEDALFAPMDDIRKVGYYPVAPQIFKEG